MTIHPSSLQDNTKVHPNVFAFEEFAQRLVWPTRDALWPTFPLGILFIPQLIHNPTNAQCSTFSAYEILIKDILMINIEIYL
jgi:hypothetical protein